VALVVLRSAVFVFWPQAHFDSDQAVTGLMAKHLRELRAFPVFWYGQSYLLAVEAWLAAPVMLVLGPTVTALKLPLLGMNVAIALLLFDAICVGGHLPPPRAAFATLFFVLAAPITSAHLLTANGGNVEPLLYVLLLWYARRHGVWLGLVLGIGFLNREFTLYGAIALLAVAALRRELFTRGTLARFATMTLVASAVWLLAQLARRYSSAAGPGTSIADLYTGMPSTNLGQLMHRACFDLAALAGGVRALVTDHFPQLFGTQVQAVVDFGVETSVRQGMRGGSIALALTVVIALVRIVTARGGDPRGLERFEFCIYLLIVSILSVTGYLTGRCGEVALFTMRYELLSILGLVALAAWFLGIERQLLIRTAWMAIATLVLAASAAAHALIWREYLTRPPVAAKQELIRALEERHLRYGYADFWTAYYVTFMSREHVILAATDAVRIRTYNRIVDQHREVAVRVSRQRCAGGQQVTPAFWVCAP
jgi:hypothetical protein